MKIAETDDIDTACPATDHTAKIIQWVIERCSSLPLYPKPKCFAQALTARILLKILGEKPQLMLGAALNDKTMSAHAWLLCGQFTVTGAAEKHLVHKVITFK